MAVNNEAPDLAELAQQAEVIAKHTAKTYSVACLGFIPGFAFLGYADQAIATPALNHAPALRQAVSVLPGGKLAYIRRIHRAVGILSGATRKRFMTQNRKQTIKSGN